MKKYLLGLVIGVVFVAYSLIIRHQHSAPVVAPTSLSQNSSGTSGSSQSTPTNQSSSTTTPTTTAGYKDGTYNGSVANAFYGDVQVSATIQNGKITTVNFLQYPNDNPNSVSVNQQAIPYLKEEAIKAQSSSVSVVTGATLTSQAFVQSLSNALNQAMQS